MCWSDAGTDNSFGEIEGLLRHGGYYFLSRLYFAGMDFLVCPPTNMFEGKTNIQHLLNHLPMPIVDQTLAIVIKD